MERLLVVEKYVTIDDVSYEFRVDRYGRRLGLVPLDQRLPPRPTLRTGTPAPDVAAVDIDGRPVDLHAHRGSVVLLDFWVAWCPPCRAEAPRLAELHQRYGERGFAILGVSEDSPEVIREFAGEFGHAWPQISEPFDGPVHRSYRVVAYPTYYLIGRDGRIVSDDLDWTTIAGRVQELLER